MSEPKDTNVAIYSDNRLRFLGGGEITLIDMANYFSSLGINTFLYDDSQSSDMSRISEYSLIQLIKASYRSVPYTRAGFPTLYHPMPQKNTLSMHMVNFVSIHRLPSKKYLEDISKLTSKVVLSCHGIGVQRRYPYNFLVFFYQLYMRYQIRRISRTVNASKNVSFQVLTLSVASIFSRYGINFGKIAVIPSGLDIIEYKIGKNDSVFTVIFMGRVNNLQKGIRRLISVVRILNKLKPVIRVIAVGSGPDHTLLEGLHCENFHYFGYVDSKKKMELLANANLLLITSNMDPFPLVCIEGLFSGLPVVSTPVPGPEEIFSMIPDSGMIAGFSPRKLAKYVISYYDQWLGDKEDYYRRKMERSTASKGKYNLDAMNSNYLKLAISLSGAEQSNHSIM